MTLGPPAAAALAPQIAAPAPFGVFHDLRWLLVYHSSWVGFAVGLWALLGIRTLVDTVLTRAAWPAEVAAPPWREHVRVSLSFTAVQAVVLLPFAALTFSMAVTSLSWLFYVAVPVLVMIGLLVHHGTVERTWLRDPPNRASVKAFLWAFVILTAGGAVIAEMPSWARPPIAAAVGACVAWSRVRMVHALAGRVITRTRRQPFALVGIAGVVVLVMAGTTIGFAVAIAVESGRTQPPVVRSDASGPPVLVVKGFNSQWDGITRQWVDGRHRIRRFSYRGLGADGKPLPYERDDTHRSVRSLVHAMRRQVVELRRAAGAPVSIVAESEGALIAQAYMAGTPNAPVRALLLLSPLVEPGRVHYPRLGTEGWGVVTGMVTDGIARALSWIGPVDVSSDTPLFLSIVNEEPALSRLLRCPPPEVRSFAVLPLDSGVSAPAPVEIGYPHAVVPAFHGGLLGDRTTQDLIRAVLRGRRARGSGFWSFGADVMNAGAAAWQAPSLVTSLEPSWDARLDDEPCRAVRAEIRSWLD